MDQSHIEKRGLFAALTQQIVIYLHNFLVTCLAFKTNVDSFGGNHQTRGRDIFENIRRTELLMMHRSNFNGFLQGFLRNKAINLKNDHLFHIRHIGMEKHIQGEVSLPLVKRQNFLNRFSSPSEFRFDFLSLLFAPEKKVVYFRVICDLP